MQRHSDGRLTAALGYSGGRGWAVLPCDGKVPHTRHGLKDASTDPDTIRSWWSRWPRANVAVATGPSNLVVIDVDGATGLESLWQLAKHGWKLAPTLSQVTGSGGAHYLYAMPAERLGNTTGRLPGVPHPTPGLDLRGDGGYIVVAPSRTTGRYEWLKHWPATVSDAPYWLRKPPRRPPVRLHTGTRSGAPRVEALAKTVREAPEGQRNHVLNWAAYRAREIRDVSPDQLAADLWQAGVDAGLETSEIRATLRSGLGVAP